MKALTLWQPWASLIAIGVKTIETRSRSTSYRGPLAIHAARRDPDSAAAQRDPGTCAALDLYPDGAGLPLGAVVATCNLVDVVGTEAGWWCDPVQWGESTEDEEHLRSAGWGFGGDDPFFITDQRPYGDFTPGRYAWLLDDIQPLDPPIAAKGHQGLWEWEGVLYSAIRAAAKVHAAAEALGVEP